MFQKTQGRSVTGGWANVAAVSAVTGLMVLNSDLLLTATLDCCPGAAATANSNTATTAVKVTGFSKYLRIMFVLFSASASIIRHFWPGPIRSEERRVGK